jgi:hypothetical protein
MWFVSSGALCGASNWQVGNSVEQWFNNMVFNISRRVLTLKFSRKNKHACTTQGLNLPKNARYKIDIGHQFCKSGILL